MKILKPKKDLKIEISIDPRASTFELYFRTDQTLVNIVFCSTFNLNSKFIFGVRICATKAQVQSFQCLHLYM